MDKELLTKIRENPFIAINRLLNVFYSLMMFPLRVIIYKRLGWSTQIHPLSSINNYTKIKVGFNCEINRCVNLWITNLEMGNYVQINPGTSIYGKVSIGSHVMIAPNCMIAGGNHGTELSGIPMRFQKSTEKGICIEDDVWIGANSVILDGVNIGRGCIIGAGSVVNKNIPAYSVAVGNPARIIKNRK